MHNFLMTITATLPMRTIKIGADDYLQRYFVAEDEDGSQRWLHRFLRNDSERHLHSHPWCATSFILCGRYTEQLRVQYGDYYYTYSAGDTNEIAPDTLHRISAVEPDTWTLMTVAPERLTEWFFLDDSNKKETMKTSDKNWWNFCKTRDGFTAFANSDLIDVLESYTTTIAQLQYKKNHKEPA